MLARSSTAALAGIEAYPVQVEVDLAPGLPALVIVGLADAAVQESRERVRSALRNSGLRLPLSRVVVSLAPADRRKQGPSFDLPIALALACASGQLRATGGDLVLRRTRPRWPVAAHPRRPLDRLSRPPGRGPGPPGPRGQWGGSRLGGGA